MSGDRLASVPGMPSSTARLSAVASSRRPPLVRFFVRWDWFPMKYAPYVIAAIVFVGIGAWFCWQWMRSQSAPPTPASTAFRMPIDDAFALKVPGKVVVVGKVAEGEVRPGDRLKIKHGNDEIPVEVEALEASGSPVSVGRSGSNIGIMLVGASKEQVLSGATLVR